MVGGVRGRAHGGSSKGSARSSVETGSAMGSATEVTKGHAAEGAVGAPGEGEGVNYASVAALPSPLWPSNNMSARHTRCLTFTHSNGARIAEIGGRLRPLPWLTASCVRVASPIQLASHQLVSYPAKEHSTNTSDASHVKHVQSRVEQGQERAAPLSTQGGAAPRWRLLGGKAPSTNEAWKLSDPWKGDFFSGSMSGVSGNQICTRSICTVSSRDTRIPIPNVCRLPIPHPSYCIPHISPWRSRCLLHLYYPPRHQIVPQSIRPRLQKFP